MAATPAPRPGRESNSGGRGGERSQAANANEPAAGPTSGTILIDIAASVLLATEVKTAYSHLKKMKPNPGAVRIAASKWYDASEEYGKSIGALKSCWIQLGGYWEGRAYDAFKSYMSEIAVPAAEKNVDVLFEIGNALIDVHNKIVEQYDEGMQSYVDTVTRAIDFHKDLDTMEGDAKNAAWKALHNVISLWVSGMLTRKAKVETIAAHHAGMMTALRGKVQQLQAPHGMPAAVSDKKRWDYVG